MTRGTPGQTVLGDRDCHGLPARWHRDTLRSSGGLAARLLTAMIIGFGALVWAPSLFTHPGEHMVWAGNAINPALMGAAWVVADSWPLPT